MDFLEENKEEKNGISYAMSVIFVLYVHFLALTDPPVSRVWGDFRVWPNFIAFLAF